MAYVHEGIMSMPDAIDQLDILNTYREAEVRGAELLRRLLRANDDPKMTGYFTWQLADEARHIELLTELVTKLGGTPPVIRNKALPARCKQNSSNPTLEILAYLHATEARLQQRYLEHIRRRHALSGRPP